MNMQERRKQQNAKKWYYCFCSGCEEQCTVISQTKPYEGACLLNEEELENLGYWIKISVTDSKTMHEFIDESMEETERI